LINIIYHDLTYLSNKKEYGSDESVRNTALRNRHKMKLTQASSRLLKV